MKKLLYGLLCFCLVLGLIACGKNADAPAQTEAEEAGIHTTLMVYMVGSDLEAKGGAGTNDLEEMLASQVDLTANNVLIYAGGSKKWHNETVSTEAGHTLMQLTAEGLKTLETREEVSMGEADTLAYFLNYAHENFPAKNFGLILWDHGNGPLIGYGKDMLHDNDSLTLIEMKTALEASPFKGDSKLSWVGFDACLMSSVELACIWQDHAQYLIASQEIEPSFGWNYAFLQNLGKLEAPELAGKITENYMESCLAYYEKKNFGQRDTTLACMDLSKVEPLKTALTALFEKATNDLNTSYAKLVGYRVNTRALGRSTTGSEYDLVDLLDMAEQMKGQYPQEAAAITQAVQEMVVHNVTNTTGCCGMSLYYPFYNKSYYEKSWGSVYSQLGVLPAYADYLTSYATQWLKNDLMDTTASSNQPQAVTGSTFTLELTPEQAKTYADAGYYILIREGDQLYTTIYASHDVSLNGTTLTANFDGNILYAKNNLGQYWIPVVDEHDTVGDYTRYSTYVNLTNGRPVLGDNPEGFQRKTAGYRFHFSVNNQTKQIQTSALVPYNEAVDLNALTGGKLEDADLAQWSEYYFLKDRHLYLTRDEKGTILPLSQWVATSYLSASVSRVDDGVEFLLAPIPQGEYYLIFEVEDIQGNRYCSETLTIQGQNVDFPSAETEDIANVSWDSGSKVQLFSQEGVTVYLETLTKYDGSVTYNLVAENKNNFDVAILGHNIFLNDQIDCSSGSFGYFNIPAGQTAADDGISFGDAWTMGQMQDLRSLQLELSVVTASGDQTLVHRKIVNVNLSAYAAGLLKEAAYGSDYYVYDQPVLGLQAGQQTVFNENGVKVTLLGLGGNGATGEDARIVMALKLENTSNAQQTIRLEGVRFDNLFLNKNTGPITILPGTVMYKYYILTDDDLALHKVTTASSVKLQITRMEFATLVGGGGFSETAQYSISLSRKGAALQVQTGSKVLYEDSAVRIVLREQYAREYGGYVWVCTMTNKSGQALALASANASCNGTAVALDSFNCPISLPYDTRCGAGETTVFEAMIYEGSSGSITFTPQFYDVNIEQLLWTGTQSIQLTS